VWPTAADATIRCWEGYRGTTVVHEGRRLRVAPVDPSACAARAKHHGRPPIDHPRLPPHAPLFSRQVDVRPLPNPQVAEMKLARPSVAGRPGAAATLAAAAVGASAGTPSTETGTAPAASSAPLVAATPRGADASKPVPRPRQPAHQCPSRGVRVSGSGGLRVVFAR